MKPFVLVILSAFTINCASYAQNPVVDTHPDATIFALDYSSNQEVVMNNDNAILFKDAFIDLVSNTAMARMQANRPVPGRKSFVITQMNPQTSGDAYRLVFQSKFLSRIIPIYTFIYDADQNTLSFYNPSTQSYVPQAIEAFNMNNLNNCYAYGNFNAPNPPQGADAGTQGQPAQDASFADDNTPVDTAVSVATVPPDMPDYQQPECPVDGYLWQPGYWAYNPAANGYYWVPGAWVAPPDAGLLWTPPYWGFVNGFYIFHTGYWGHTVGFYGGIDYGYGYGGVGFVGGNWYGGHFRYNTAVVRVNVTVVHNTYEDRTVYRERGPNHASFNGRGGYTARPTRQEIATAREHHIMATSEQIRNQRMAREDRSQSYSTNKGRPANVATDRVAPRGNTSLNQQPGNHGNTGGGNGPGNRRTRNGGPTPGNQGPPGNNNGPANPRNNGGNNGPANPRNNGGSNGGQRPPATQRTGPQRTRGNGPANNKPASQKNNKQKQDKQKGAPTF